MGDVVIQEKLIKSKSSVLVQNWLADGGMFVQGSYVATFVSKLIFGQGQGSFSAGRKSLDLNNQQHLAAVLTLYAICAY